MGVVLHKSPQGDRKSVKLDIPGSREDTHPTRPMPIPIAVLLVKPIIELRCYSVQPLPSIDHLLAVHHVYQR